jgi:hypothetical protein
MEERRDCTTFQIQEPPSEETRVPSPIFFTFVRPLLAEIMATALLVFVDVCGWRYGFVNGFTLFVLVAATANVRYVGGSVSVPGGAKKYPPFFDLL